MDIETFEQAKQDQTRRLSNAILRRTLVNVVMFSLVYLIAFFGFMTFFGSSVSDFVFDIVGGIYSVHQAYQSLFLLCVMVGFVVGVVLVVRNGINRALRYFDLLLDSMTDMLTKSDEAILLPSELTPTAMFLNAVRWENQQNAHTAKAAEERKNELVMYLAHDIKTPLTSVIGYLSLLDESPDLPIDVRARYTNITLAKAYSLEALLEEFFEITRYNLHAIPVERSRFDGALFVHQVMDEFYPLAEGRSLDLVFDGPEEFLVFADAGKVARVLNNVLKNAVAYADTGTEVGVRTGLVAAASGYVWWELTVTDQGRELAPEHLERLFKKFFRADEARGSMVGGAGLGLAIAREITRAHGGDIYVKSDAGFTSFTIWIPQGPAS